MASAERVEHKHDDAAQPRNESLIADHVNILGVRLGALLSTLKEKRHECRRVRATGARGTLNFNAAFLLGLLLVAVMLPQAAAAHKNILMVFDEDKDLPGLAGVNRSLRDGFTRGLSNDVNFYDESLNLSQFRNPDYEQTLVDHFHRKYGGHRPDLVVAIMGPSLDFLLRHGEALFPGVPIVFSGADASDLVGRKLRTNISGVLLKRSFAGTLDIALRLQPDTSHVFIVGGTSRFDRELEAIARRDFEPFKGRVQISYLTSLPLGDLLKTLSSLPAHSVVMFLSLFSDGAGRAFVPHDILPRISEAANAPVYVSVDQFVGLGPVGGNVYSMVTQAEKAVEIGLRILRGGAVSNIPVVERAVQADVFDWRQFQRWGLDERRLRPGATFNFRSPSAWEQYRWYITGSMILLLLQTALIVTLISSRAHLRRADRATSESEARRHRAEAEALKQRGELAHALRVSTLGELTVSFAHEISQPLTAIVANAAAARRFIAADQQKQDDVEEALVDIIAAADHAAQTIERIRALCRKENLQHVKLDINRLIEDVVELLRIDAQGKHISMRFVRGEKLPLLLGDPVQLRQVVLNLLVNAADAIAVSTDGPREIRVESSLSEAGHIHIAIRDSGVGAEESELERIFEHFVTAKPNGLGMGLAISRSIVEAHNGCIWAARNIDRGLTLHIKLPVQTGDGGKRDAG